MRDLSYKLFFKAFSNKTRFQLINLLRKKPMNVSELIKATGFEQTRISHNLKCLIECGFVTNRREGKTRIYSLNKETIEPLLNIVDKHIGKYIDYLVVCGILKK